MALVLRKALVPKNVSLFKFVRGRPLTTTQKKNPAPFSKAALCRSPKEEKVVPLGRRRFSGTKHLFEPLSQHGGARRSQDVRFCVSCPNLVPESRAKIHVPVRHISPPRFRFIFKDPSYMKSSPALSCIRSHLTDLTLKRPYSKCPPPSPPPPNGPTPCGCNCLPPPCNVPPRCIQFMTGYYYYPYGTWFCGPYHVQKPCCPDGPCGCGPCGPCCGPCGPCGPCCICPDCSAAPAFASAIVGAAPKENKTDTLSGSETTYTPKEFVETKQEFNTFPKQSNQTPEEFIEIRQHFNPIPKQSSQNQKQSSQNQKQSSQNQKQASQKSKNPYNLNSSINLDKPISPAGFKKVTPVVNSSKFKNITSPRVVPPVMSSTFVTLSGSRFNGYGCRWSSRYMSSDVERPIDPTPPACQTRPFNTTRPSFRTYVAQVPLSHLNSASTPISAQKFTKVRHPFKLPPEQCSRGQSTFPNKRKLLGPFENPAIPSPPTPTELEYYSSFKQYSRPASSVNWIFKTANADKLCPKYK